MREVRAIHLFDPSASAGSGEVRKCVREVADPLLNGKAQTVEREHNPRCQGEEQSNVQAAWTQPLGLTMSTCHAGEQAMELTFKTSMVSRQNANARLRQAAAAQTGSATLTP